MKRDKTIFNLLVMLLLSITVASNKTTGDDDDDCEADYAPVGCYIMFQGSQILLNDRLVPNGIDWLHYPGYLRSLRFWGECWGSHVLPTHAIPLELCAGDRAVDACTPWMRQCMGRGCTDFFYQRVVEISSMRPQSAWSSWSLCSRSCGNGTQQRFRVCRIGECDEKFGNSVQLRTCLVRNYCPVGSIPWSDWSDWSPCSAKCGGGSQDRRRLCTDNKPTASNVSRCSSSEMFQTRTCIDNPACEHRHQPSEHHEEDSYRKPWWPEEFLVSRGESLNGYKCLKEGPHQLCYTDYSSDPGISLEKAPINGRQCIRIGWGSSNALARPRYLCSEREPHAYNFTWSNQASTTGLACVLWAGQLTAHGTASSDHFLCSQKLPDHREPRDVPGSIDQFRWSWSGQLEGMRCVPAQNTAAGQYWSTSFLCHNKSHNDPGIRWSQRGLIPNMTCSMVVPKEATRNPKLWREIYICSPIDLPYSVQWITRTSPVRFLCLYIPVKPAEHKPSSDRLCLREMSSRMEGENVADHN